MFRLRPKVRLVTICLQVHIEPSVLYDVDHLLAVTVGKLQQPERHKDFASATWIMPGHAPIYTHLQ